MLPSLRRKWEVLICVLAAQKLYMLLKR
ncbi:unnamed protein product [Staurois parvus]|uniref:Uncharacterized protein n=1 Tax=Staurois parvus TaxID=386267 RepID=A0ABN9GY46_9NEOB|nr:unnamed protein product [Staurois parvus]